MWIIRFIKDWTLPVSMISGALAYFLGRTLPLTSETKNILLTITEDIQPWLLFCMLFVAFCKVKPSALRPHKWHLWLLLIQSILFIISCLTLYIYPETEARLILEGFMLSIICPTATACAVVTQKLGGDSASTTSYTIIINLAAAILIPTFVPLTHLHLNTSIETSWLANFLPAFFTIIRKIFPLLMLPLLLAWIVRYTLPRLHHYILGIKDLAFYMWAIALAIAIAVTCRALAHSNESLWNVAGIAVASFVACIFQFYVGKKIGANYGMRMEAGQAMGQKNTVFIIWLGYTFLSPISATAGGFYSVWHNVVNSYQLYKKRKQDVK